VSSATVEVLDRNSVVSNEKTDLSPEKTWTKEVPVKGADRKYSFVLKDGDGKALLKQTEGKYDWAPESEVKVGPQQNYRVPDEGKRSEDDWLQLGKMQELDGDLLSAVGTYQAAFQKFPSSYELTKAAGRLDASLKRFDEAIPRLLAVHQRNTTDAEASYYLGVSLEGAGETQRAMNAYEGAFLAPAHRAAATLRLAEMKARQGDLKDALRLIDESLKSEPNDLRAGEEKIAIMSATGDREFAARQAKELLKRYPSSSLLREEAGLPDPKHLAADPYRVLRVASQYADLGLYKKSVEILSRNYPAVDPDQSEPGMTLPQKNPLIAYFRGYCREKLGESAADDYAEASRLSTLYVFPSTLDDKLALDAALRFNSKDATAHYLLGVWYFARAKTPEALRHWADARERNPKIPALAASMGLALLHEARDFSRAFEAFDAGIKDDPRNMVNYSGAMVAMTLLGRSAQDRVEELERYPDLKQMPNSLVYELALNRAEAGDHDGAINLFRDRFFSREEGGTNVRQVWVEVRLLQAAGLAKAENCQDALKIADTLGKSVAELSFTQDGLDPFVEAPRTRYLLGDVYATCGQREKAAQEFAKASEGRGANNLLWAWAASKKAEHSQDSDSKVSLLTAAAEAEARSKQGSHQGLWHYASGILWIAAGQPDHGNEQLRETFLSPDDALSHHLARLALAGATPR